MNVNIELCPYTSELDYYRLELKELEKEASKGNVKELPIIIGVYETDELS